MPRRLEDKIRSLVAQLVDTKDEKSQIRKLHELRQALHEYMVELRGRLSAYPFVKEQRALNGIPRPEVPGKIVGPAEPLRVPQLDPAPAQEKRKITTVIVRRSP